MILSEVSLVALAAAIALVAAPSASCVSSARPGLCTDALGIAIFLASLLLLIALVTGVVAWIIGLLQAADEKRWGWFVAAVLLGVVGSLAYGLARPAATAETTSAPVADLGGYDRSRCYG
jgi:hypothetical protein